MQIVTIAGEGYIVLGVVSVNTSYDTDQLKSQWRLADAVLRNNQELYICMKIIDVEFNDI